jgi:hypothetical protein
MVSLIVASILLSKSLSGQGQDLARSRFMRPQKETASARLAGDSLLLGGHKSWPTVSDGPRPIECSGLHITMRFPV